MTTRPGTVIDLLRHGEVEGGLCLGAHADATPSAVGARQVDSWARAPWRWAGIVSSPLGRCRAAARTLGASLGLTPRIEPRFREIGFGEWEGRPWTELLREHGDALFAFWACPGDHPAPGGEDYAAFDGRVWAAFGDLIGEARGQHWLVVSHGGPIRVILRRALDLPVGRLFDIDVPYGSLARVQVDETGAPLLLWHRSPP